jgi:hypothetical protein
MTFPRAIRCPNCGCEIVACLVKLDNFTRTAAGPGADWEELDGAWPTNGSHLKPPTDGDIRLVQSVPTTSTDGYRWKVTFNFGNANGTVRFKVDWVDDASDDTYHYLEFTATALASATIQLFSMSAGTPTALNVATPIPGFDRRDDNVVSVCVNVTEGEIVASVDPDGVIESSWDYSVTLNGGTKVGFETIGVSTNAYFDDAELSRLGGSLACANCDVLQPCTGPCTNSDATRPNKALPNIKISVANLLEGFTDNTRWKSVAVVNCSAFGAGDIYDVEAGSNGVDDRTWDVPALDGTYIIPFASCGAVTNLSPNNYNGDAVSYSRGFSDRVVTQGMIYNQGERPLSFNGCFNTPCSPSLSDMSCSALTWHTVPLEILSTIWLVKLSGGTGFKIVAQVTVRNITTMLDHTVNGGASPPYAWGDLDFTSCGSTVTFINGNAWFQADWDGDCLSWSGGDVSLAYISDSGHAELDFTSTTVSVGSP